MYTVYMVPNDMNVLEIAEMLNVNIELLKNLNGVSSDFMLKKGEYIVVPKKYSSDFIVYKVKPGDTIISIARQNNLDYEQLLDLNGLDKDQYIYENQEIMLPNKNVKFWIIKEGNTLKDVANKLQTTEQEILMQNESLYLYPEQLIIYKKETK